MVDYRRWWQCWPLIMLLWLSGCSEPRLSPLAADASILAMGDSLTRGVGASPGESYPAVLQQLTGHQVINAGISGEESDAGLRRLPALLQRYRPSVLILCHGGNDMLRKRSLAQTQVNIAKMVELAMAQGVEVVLVAVPKPGLWNDVPQFYQQIAEHYQLVFEPDILGALEHDRAMKSDLVHLNAKGYRRLAQALAERLQRSGALATPP